MWTYSQSDGWLYDDNGMKLAQGYSGNGSGLNNPAMQEVKDVGPVPCGRYTIGELQPSHPILGVSVMALQPDPDNNMFGRAGFYIHGDNPELNHSASEGCIIMPRFARDRVGESADKRLLVVSTAALPAPAPPSASSLSPSTTDTSQS